MKRITDAITAILVCGFVLLITAATALNIIKGGIALPGSGISALLSDGSFVRSISSGFTDSFTERLEWISADARIGSALGESIVNGVYMTDERLLDAENTPKKAFPGTASAVLGFAERYDGAVYFAAIPTSAGVYGELLPEYLSTLSTNTEKQVIDELYSQLETGVRKIDAYNILKMVSDNYIYFRTDNKWTGYGAYCVYRTVVQKLGFQPIAYDKYTIEHLTDSFCGELYSKTRYMKCKPDIIDIYEYTGGAEVTECTAIDSDGREYSCELYDRSAAQGEDMYNIYPGAVSAYFRIKTTVTNDRRLLVIGDDFAPAFLPFLVQHYNEIVMLSPEKISGGITQYADPDDFEQTLFLFGADTLCQSGELVRLLDDVKEE